jgi:hypothetical protein
MSLFTALSFHWTGIFQPTTRRKHPYSLDHKEKTAVGAAASSRLVEFQIRYRNPTSIRIGMQVKNDSAKPFFVFMHNEFC